jgi:hypothetical protein
MKKPDEDGRRYQAYLLRCWSENGEWRFTVERISQGRERVPIANISALIAYLQQSLYIPASYPQNNSKT